MNVSRDMSALIKPGIYGGCEVLLSKKLLQAHIWVVLRLRVTSYQRAVRRNMQAGLAEVVKDGLECRDFSSPSLAHASGPFPTLTP